jgi:hypothetical protein
MRNCAISELQAARRILLRGTVSILAILTASTSYSTDGQTAPVRLRFSSDNGQILVAAAPAPQVAGANKAAHAKGPATESSATERASPAANGNANGAGNGNGGANAGNGNGNGQTNGNANGAGNGNGGANAGNGNGNGQANGNANGAGNGNGGANPGNGNGNGQANGNANGAGNGNGGSNAGNGNGNGQANGNANGAGNGNGGTNAGNGNGNGQANGNANGSSNGNGGANAGNGNGQANGNANGSGAQEALSAQAIAAAPAASGVSQVQQFIEKGLEGKAGAKLNGTLAGIQQYSVHGDLSVFTVSGVTRLQHDGLTVSTPGDTFQGPAFTAWTYGLTAGVRWDGSRAFGLSPDTLLFGGFGHYATTDLNIEDGDRREDGSGSIKGYSVGGYTLLNMQPFYVLGIFNHGWSHAEISTPGGVELAPEGSGYLLSANAGALVAVGANVKLDLRVGVDLSRATVDDYRDSTGLAYTGGLISESTGSASAKLFSQHQLGAVSIRPFAQAGVSQRFDQRNEVEIDGAPFSFTDAEFSVFGRVGIDIDAGGFQSYLAFRGERSADRVVLGAQVGITIKLD